MKIFTALLACASLSLAADTKTLTGTIGDNMCKGDHAAMNGTDPAKCTKECVKSMGAAYALWVDKDVYTLSDQAAAAKFAGKKVTVTGEVTGTTIAVKSIKAAK
jgi:hypothetical protein